MTTLMRRRANPIADMLSWIDSESPVGLRGFGLAPYVRIEDYVEDDTSVEVPVRRTAARDER